MLPAAGPAPGPILTGLAGALVRIVNGMTWNSPACSGYGGKNGWSVSREVERMLGEVQPSADHRESGGR